MGTTHAEAASHVVDCKNGIYTGGIRADHRTRRIQVRASPVHNLSTFASGTCALEVDRVLHLGALRALVVLRKLTERRRALALGIGDAGRAPYPVG